MRRASLVVKVSKSNCLIDHLYSYTDQLTTCSCRHHHYQATGRDCRQ